MIFIEEKGYVPYIPFMNKLNLWIQRSQHHQLAHGIEKIYQFLEWKFAQEE